MKNDFQLDQILMSCLLKDGKLIARLAAEGVKPNHFTSIAAREVAEKAFEIFGKGNIPEYDQLLLHGANIAVLDDLDRIVETPRIFEETLGQFIQSRFHFKVKKGLADLIDGGRTPDAR